MDEVLLSLIAKIDEQIACWKSLRFEQTESFIDYSEYIKLNATGS